MALFRYIGGQVRQIPTGKLLRYVGGQVVSPALYRYIGGRVVNITLLGPSLPVGAFSVTPQVGAAPLTVQFTTTAATSYVWNFGDGTTSTAQNPTHTYVTAGSYAASLTVTDAAGSGTQTRTITATSATPTALAPSPTLAPSSTLLTQG